MPTTPPTIAALPTAPDPSDRPTFNTRAYSWSMALPTFGSQIGAVATNVFNNATEAAAAAASATASAQSAVLSPGTNATSTTSLTISTGSKTLTIQTGKQFAVGQFVLIASAASPQNFMLAQITSHDSGAGQLVVSVKSTGGGGTFASWSISITVPGFNGNSTRIWNDFSSAIVANRALFQSSTANSHTYVGAIPSATSAGSGFTASNSNDPDNSAYAYFHVTPSEFGIHATKLGSGTHVPFNLSVAGEIRLFISTSGAAEFKNSGGFGYGGGSGATVIQITNKTTSVTINKPSGLITTHNSSLGAGSIVWFAVYNSCFTTSDGVFLTLADPGIGISYDAWISHSTYNLFYVALKNISGGALSESVGIKFQIIKGSAS